MTAPSLAERLGYAAHDRLLIINCDDLGSSHAANVATFRAVTYGVATNASLMVPCPWAREAARMFRGLPVGIHLTLTSEHAGYRWRSLTSGTSLRDRDGFLPSTTKEVLTRLDVEEVRAECRAQIETALAWGVDVTHLDTHMDVLHASSALFDLYLDLAHEFRLPVRVPADDGARHGLAARELAAARGVLCPDRLVYSWPRRTHDILFQECPVLPSGVSELFAHPVLDGEELRGYDFQHADLRVHDAAALIDPAVTAMLDQQSIVRISYREVRELQRAA